MIDGQRYVDGAVHSATNADLLVGLGLEIVVVSSPMSAWKPGREVSAMARQFHHRVLERELAGVRRSGTRVVVFEPTAADVDAMGVNAMDPARMGAIARHTYATVSARLVASPLLSERPGA
jgi:NTE family protein